MPTLKLQFPAGRYHATPWGHHVNEGLIEWPPSPWRFLRAFIACGYSTHGWSEPPAVARQLIEKLATALPSFQLPQATASHSRHFMPIGVFKKPQAKDRTVFQFSASTTQRADLYNHFTEDTTLVFDTWANVGDSEAFVFWPCELNKEETKLLGQLATALGYLGRSESWVEAELVDDGSIELNAAPCREGEHRGREWEQISLMAALPSEAYQDWRAAQLGDVLKAIEAKKLTATQRKKELAKAESPYPNDLLACLQKDTVWWKGHGWSQPPGSQRVLYWRRSDALQVTATPTPRRPAVRPVEAMLLAITSPSGNRSALPPVAWTLRQAEKFHETVVSRAATGGRIDCPSLTGKDLQNRPLRERHIHAHTIPLDLDGDGHLEHILVYAKGKLCGDAQRAIRASRRTWMKGGAGELQLAVVASGSVDVLRQLRNPFGRRIEMILGPPSGASVWESITPFVPIKTMDGRGRRQIESQIRAELASRQLPDAVKVEIDPKLTRGLRHFVRRRQPNKAQPKVDAGYGLRVELSEPISGPLLLGYGSHYGLGLFQAKAT
jgi:CRISPR-associated protein Csb2